MTASYGTGKNTPNATRIRTTCFSAASKFRDYGFDVDEVAGALHEEVVDAHHSTEDQLLAKARELYAEFNQK